MASSKVQVYIYDLSQGLAAQLSPLFLGEVVILILITYYYAYFLLAGKQINGVW